MSGLVENGGVVLDIGAGTCVLSIPILMLGESVKAVAVDADRRLGGLCLEAARSLGVRDRIVYTVQWISEGVDPPLSGEPVLAVTNPPFGVWRKGADWEMLGYGMRSGAPRIYAILKSGNLDLHVRRAAAMGYGARLLWRRRFPIKASMERHRSRVRWIDVDVIAFDRKEG
jgi:putative methylase